MGMNLRHPLLAHLTDIRSIGLVVFAIIVLLVSWSGVRAIQTNYQLEKQIARMQQENDLQKLKNENQKLKNQYYKTPQYLELAARQNFGLAMPGEKELIVPKEVAMKYVKGVEPVSADPARQPSEARKHVSFYERNWQAWVNFFLNRTD
jgi:cell division protein FtsB